MIRKFKDWILLAMMKPDITCSRAKEAITLFCMASSDRE